VRALPGSRRRSDRRAGRTSHGYGDDAPVSAPARRITTVLGSLVEQMAAP
jgi:hypothetical protein